MTEREYGEIDIMYYGKRISMEFDLDLSAPALVEEVIAPMMIAMGYFPTTVYTTLNMQETLDIIDNRVKK